MINENMKPHIFPDNKRFVFIGNGTTANIINWDTAKNSETYLTFVSNLAWQKYKGRCDYHVFPVECLQELIDYLPEEWRTTHNIIDVNEDMIRTFKTNRQGSFTAFFEYILTTQKNRIIVFQGVDFDDDSRNWRGRYAPALLNGIKKNLHNNNKLYTVSDGLYRMNPEFREYIKPWKIEK